MRLTDKTLTCLDCAGSFVFTAAEQQMLVLRGRREEPNRCPRCYRRAGHRHAQRDTPPWFSRSIAES